jgi:hypothetical protein
VLLIISSFIAILLKLLRFITFLILLNCQGTAHSQSRQSLLLQVDSLKAALDRVDTLDPLNQEVDNIYDTISTVHAEIWRRLEAILMSPLLMTFDLDSLLKHPGLSIARSKDKRLWIFSWYENTGGSFHSSLNLVYYRTASNKPKVRRPAYEDATEQGGIDDGLYSLGLGYGTIYQLKSGGKNLYLCLGGARTCNTCIVDVATVVELTRDGINFDYPAFIDGREEKIIRYTSSFLLESRIGSVEYFKFDPKTQTLSFRYTTDDNTPVKSEHEKVIARKLRFDGKKFVGNGYE